MPKPLNNLGSALNHRFKHLDEVSNLMKAVKYMGHAVSLTPQGHSILSMRLSTLGNLYLALSKYPGMTGNIEQALNCFQKSAEHFAGCPVDIYESALGWVRLFSKHRISSVLQAYQQTMTLVPQLVWLGSAMDSRYRSIIDIGNVATEAAAVAIYMEDYQLVLEWLKEGRSIVWKQMLQLRTPINDLSAVEPILAEKLRQVARNLDSAGSPGPEGDFISQDTPSLEQSAQQYCRLAEKWEELLEQAHALPGFEAFLRPQKATELMCAAHSGPVVVINIHETCCDALVIKSSTTQVSHILFAFSHKTTIRSRTQLVQFLHTNGLASRGIWVGGHAPTDLLKKTLSVLWIEVVKPVLNHLGYAPTSIVEDLPHITWATGPLLFLPLHAAGDYDSQSMVFDYVISLYTHTISALLSPLVTPMVFSGILAVGQTSTAGMPLLPGTEAELSRIQDTANGLSMTRLNGDLATPDAVLAAIEEHSWVHFACPAKQDTAKPLDMLDPAIITQKQLKHAELMFLSACQTTTGDEKLSKESVHLVEGMLMAGYRGVIATMWSIRDENVPLIAEKVYEHLLVGGKPDTRKAAVAVHKATGCLRVNVGVKAFAKWVPYIHIGL